MHSSSSRAISQKWYTSNQDHMSLTRIKLETLQGYESLKMQEGAPMSFLGSPGYCPSKPSPFSLKKSTTTQAFSLSTSH